MSRLACWLCRGLGGKGLQPMLKALERLEPPEDSEEREGGFPTLEKMLPRLSFKS
jgi:hypothetical protein